MKHIRHTLILIAACLLSVSAAFSQDVSTQGTEFWVSFMGNGYKVHLDETWLRIQLLISAKNACSCTIANPRTGWQQSFDIEANGTYLYDNIDEQQAYIEMTEAEMVLDKGLLITSTDSVSVYCSNIAIYSFDVSCVIPTEGLADDYIIQTYDQSSNYDFETSAFLIVATEDNTTVDITPACSTLRERPAGETFTITMSRGQSYMVRSNKSLYGSRDLSGSRVTARDCKKIAVFNGNNLTMVPFTSDFDGDCIFEQAMPVHSWGKRFIVTTSLTRDKDYVKITSSTNDNEILKNGQHLCTLNANQSYTFPLSSTDKSCYLEASGSSAVYLYNASTPNHGIGAPSMVWIAPLEQRIDEITFSTFNYDHPNANINAHYLNVIVNKVDVGHVYLDGELLPVPLFENVTGNDDYCFYRQSIEHGVHHLTCEKGLNAHVYGFGEARGYAYMVGSKARILNTSLSINNLAILPNDDFKYCVEEPITFEAEVNIQNYRLLWDFGDGTTSTENPVTHTYNEKRIYTAMLIVSTEESTCQPAATDTTLFYIDASQQYIIENDEICADELYSGHGFNNVFINNDTILCRLQDNPLHPVCQDSLLVYVTVHSASHSSFDDSRCWHGEPTVYEDHGFRFVYNQPGVYDRQLNLQTLHGCDSIIDLHLTVADQITYEFDHNECSNSYVWDGQAYSVSGDYERYYVSEDGCDSIVTLHLTIGLPQHTSFDTITCGTFLWNGQYYTVPGDYQQQFTTVNGCDSIVDCHLTLGSDVEGATTEVSGCDSYHWLGTDYTVSGLYDKTLSAVSGCDSIIHLDLTLDYSPSPKMGCANSNAVVFGDTIAVVTNTEFFSFPYDFYLQDTLGHINDWDTCEWRISRPSWMIEPYIVKDEPDKRFCRVHVAEHSDNLVELNATVIGCDTVSTVFYLKSSFLNIEEQHTTQPDFSIVPNPNNGQMTLHFENLIENINIKIFDTHGALIDQFQVNSDASSYSIPYQCKSLSEGLYFFMATGQNKVLTKKVNIYR